ncbi:uncharacterized protein ACB058_001236 [Synchiropus picturatus]
MSHKTLQRCHCGWSSVTTYHGLRTHQGKNGCTPKGQRIPQDQYSKCTSSSSNSLRHGSSEKDGDRMKSRSEKHTVLPSGDNKGTEQTRDSKSTRSSFRNVSAPLIKTEKPSPDRSTSLTDEMSHMTLQRCHCGWSSVTTYHGLRTHQGINECTPRGQRIPQYQYSKSTSSSSNSLRHGSSEKDGDRMKSRSEKHTVLPSGDNKGTEQTQDSKSTRSSFRNVSAPLIKTEKPSPDRSTNLTDEMSHKTLQSCHCGWSSVTTYHGLRTHQGKKGCTPKGETIPQNEYSSYSFTSSSWNSPRQGLSTGVAYDDKPRMTPSVPGIFQSSVATVSGMYGDRMMSSSEQYAILNSGNKGREQTWDSKSVPSPSRNVSASLIHIEEPLLDPSTNLIEDPYKEVSIMDPMTQLGVKGNAPPATALPRMSLSLIQSQHLECLQQSSGLLPSVASQQEKHSISFTPLYPAIADEALIQMLRGMKQPDDLGKIPPPQMYYLPQQQMSHFNATSTHTVAPTRAAITATDSTDLAITDKRSLQEMMGNPSNSSGNSRGDLNNFPSQPSQQTSGPLTEDPSKTQLLLAKDPGGSSTANNSAVFQTPQGNRKSVSAAEQPRRRLDFSADKATVAEELGKATAIKADDAALDVREKENQRTAQKMLKTRQDQMRTFLELEARAREKRLAEVKSSVKDCAKRLADEWLEIDLVFLEVMKTVEDTWQRALQPLEQRRLDMEKEASAVLQKLEGDIGSFKRQMKEMEQNPSVQVPSLKTVDRSKDWKKLSVNMSSSFGSLKTSTSSMVDEIKQKLEKLSVVELKRMPTFADGKNVKDGGNRQEGADSPKKFTLFGSVLASNTFTSGRCYWEVEVTNKTGWDLGVASGKANRKGKINLHSGNGYWVIVHYEGSKYAALSVPATSLSLKSKPDRVGVFVDYEDGLVSFYNVTDQSHIYSYTGCAFSEEIHPYFSPHLRQNEMNAEPLVICPVEKSH